MHALEALTVHSNRLTDLAFTGTTFLYAERVVMGLKAAVKKGLQLRLD